jgi:hypothetical protein
MSNIIIDKLEELFKKKVLIHYRSGIHVEDWKWKILKDAHSAPHPVIAPAVIRIPPPLHNISHPHISSQMAAQSTGSGIAHRGNIGTSTQGQAVITGTWISPSGHNPAANNKSSDVPPPVVKLSRRRRRRFKTGNKQEVYRGA